MQLPEQVVPVSLSSRSMTVLPNRVRGLLTDTVVSRLRRESRDARKNRYSASQEKLSTKSDMRDVKTINFFCNLQKNHIAKHRKAFSQPF